MTTATAPKTFAEAEAILASRLPRYESRRPQQIGAQAVEQALATGQHLLLQAGTGTGKSLLYLIPAILSGRRTVVTTATRALQSQLTSKDLPFLQEHLGTFTWAMLQGRSNYLCGNRALLIRDEEPLVAKILEVASEATFSGLRDDLGFEVPAQVWAKVCAEAEECRDLGCRDSGRCFATLARKSAEKAQIVVVNHSLLCTDMVVQRDYDFSMLGEYDVVVVDEVHELATYAKSALGVEFSEGAILSLLAQVRTFVTREISSHADELRAAEGRVLAAKDMLWAALSMQMEQGSNVMRLRPAILGALRFEWEGLIKALGDYARLLREFPPPTESKPARRWALLKNRALRVAGRLLSVITDDMEATVSWLEVVVSRKGERHIVVKSQPIFVDEFLRSNLFNSNTVIMTSATAKPFDFLVRQLGAEGSTTLDVGTSFDYPRQALIYVPRGMPAPAGATRQRWEAEAPKVMLELVRASEGRALLLFTSIAAMNRAYESISRQVPWTCYKQGQDSVPNLSRKFRENVHSILFATRSFMTGLDISGESLSLVVLDKMVFTAPNDPAYEAECEVIESRGDSSFAKLALPQMIMTTEQAAGRLIRSREDRGVFAVLDSRLVEKGYGKSVLRSLPPMKLTTSLADVQRFFS